MNESEHKCFLSKGQTKSIFGPLHPHEGWKAKLKIYLKKLIMLNENDVRCKHFFRSGAALLMEQRKHANSRYWFIIHPFSILSQILVILFFFGLMHRWISPRVMLEQPYWYILTSNVRDCVHVFVMLTFFITGFADNANKKIYTLPRETIKRYLYGYFFIDLFFLMEGRNLFISPWNNKPMIGHSIKIPVSFVSLILYAIRFKSLSHIIKNIALRFGLGTISIFLITHGAIVILILHLQTILLFKIPFYVYYLNDFFPHDSWVYTRNLSFEKYTADIYAEGFLIIISYFIGCSHGVDITQPCEQLLIFLCTMSGRLYTLFIIGKVLAHFGFTNTADSKYENLMIQFNSYMSSLGIPTELEARITEKFEYMCQKKLFNLHQMISTLTDHLKTELFLYGAKSLVVKNRFLNQMAATELAFLFSHMKSTIYGSHEIILGEYITPHLYFVSSGSGVGYIGNQELFHIEDGDIFGIQSIYPESRKKHPFYVITVEPSEVYYVNKKWIMSLIGNHPELGKLLYDILKKRIERIIHYNKRKYSLDCEIRDRLKEGKLLEKLKKRPSQVYF